MRNVTRFAAIAALSALSCASSAGTFRAYLSINGNDANPCSLGQPCRLMAAALAAANDGGEIWIMDSGNFNTTTLDITKSVSIVAVPGAIGSIFSINGPAVNIATAGVKVSFKNLVIKSLAGQGSTMGVVATNGSSLTIEGCTISDMPDRGVLVNAALQVTIVDSTIRNNYVGVEIGGFAKASLARVIMTGNYYGILGSGGGAAIDVRDSIASGNVNAGILGNSSAAAVKIAVVGTQMTGNANGIIINGSATKATLTGNLLANNSTGVNVGSGATVLLSDNTVSGNGTGIFNSGSTVTTTSSNTVSQNATDTTGAITTIGKT